MEDARFVRFVDDDGTVTYFATYTAFDQVHIAPQLLKTTDFATFDVTQLSGPFATNKGMALFPRKIGGRYMALSRWDRENLAVTTSDDLSEWDEATTLELGPRPWELVQVGNCGSPRRDPRGLARLDPRCRADAYVWHRCHPSRPRRPAPRDRRASRTRCWKPTRTSARDMSRTSSTRAGRSSTARHWCCPMGFPTAPSASRSSTSPSS